MPQEGAMKMGKLGYSYLDILDFYFKNIKIIDLQKLDFLKTNNFFINNFNKFTLKL